MHTGPISEPDFVAVLTPTELERMAVGVRRLAADLDDATVIPLQSARPPGEVRGTIDGVPVYDTHGVYRYIGDPEAGAGRGEPSSA